MIDIHIKSIPHDKQRYNTLGDFYYDQAGTLHIMVSELGDPFAESMIAIHEFIEEMLTRKRGLTEPEILNFDLYYEERIKQGLVDPDSEPGFSNEAPYMREHIFADSVERMICAFSGLSWNDYEQKLNELT